MTQGVTREHSTSERGINRQAAAREPQTDQRIAA
jgi:hypothetical protein